MCGIGFVAHLTGERAHAVIRDALALLGNLAHRGAVGCDPCTGDGAGITIQLPHYFLGRAFGALPEAGGYGIGVAFLPRDAEPAKALIERAISHERLRCLGWRSVPVDETVLGDVARRSAPAIWQFAVDTGAPILSGSLLERRLYVLRRRIEREARDAIYIASLSSRTMVYKGMLRPDQLARFYGDLSNPDVASGLALVHSRFSTNTLPSWALAHPYRYICHNGEINTLRGNLVWTRAREEQAYTGAFANDRDVLFPIIAPNQSDSACLDNALEFLVMGGRPLSEAMLMMIPEAWDGDARMDPDRKAFYEYHAGTMEPWDGPAAIAFTDGVQIGATLDRNGLRPARYIVTDDDLVILASEAGALPVRAEAIRTKGRLRPGHMLLVDTASGQIVPDESIKAHAAARAPYREWLDAGRRSLSDLPATAIPASATPPELARRAFGYTAEDIRVILGPMGETGEEPVGSMGNDTPIAVLSDRPQLLYRYFRQLFAQVTNPAIDPIREQLVMSLAVTIGARGNVLTNGPQRASRVRLTSPILGDADLARLPSTRLDIVFGDNLGAALETIMAKAADIARRARMDGVPATIVLSDRAMDHTHCAIPALLAVAAVHHHLLRARLRSDISIIAETGEAREVAHVALLIGYGATAVNPYLALATTPDEVLYRKALDKGLLKILSKMGISTIQSYCGAQQFEAIGLARDVVDRYFTGTPSRLGGIDLETIGRETLMRHRGMSAEGEYSYRAGGLFHAWNPRTIASLQHATRHGDAAAFRTFSDRADAEAERYTLRGHLALPQRTPVPLDEVEPASAIVKRFSTGAMSFGSLGKEAHETLALAMNRLGGRSNTGEGGEEPARYGTERSSAIKQVASGRFGVTTEYLVNARELQIKIAQGAKPGEGGQLPGHKVDAIIAATRYSTPGVTLISPPPHHDIYSIEDLAQLIFDLKNVNPAAAISVKLVSEAGVGTIAAGVAKAHADRIVIAGDSGGTGASPLSSIKHAGVPWELGLADAHQALMRTGLRSRVRLETDGQLKTGRDVVIAALLGAEEFGFSTAPLITLGCVMMRKCHLNTCPVGIATQDPVLRQKFSGTPEAVITYFFLLAEDIRRIMAGLGVARFDELVGRTELLEQRSGPLDLSALLAREEGSRFCVRAQDHGLREQPTTTITTADRATGAMVAGDIARGRDAGAIVTLTGSAGQSFGAFAVRGMSLRLEGEANDYVGKGLSGGHLVIVPPKGVRYIPEETTIIGNTALYGATSGEAFIYGMAGERFAVRLSGAHTVVEGVGDHACEYMTGGIVIVLGRTGRNFAAGMSGGFAAVYDIDGRFAERCNTGLVSLEPLVGEDRSTVHALLERYASETGSARARQLLRRWPRAAERFVQVMPREFKQARMGRTAHG
ncbi:MAG TPA: glutamate synthase large subunit [Gemmatimonadaceae bacterium]|nr:glutamate synthase large subunit [Gemmatimonadaceae bacterium]